MIEFTADHYRELCRTGSVRERIATLEEGPEIVHDLAEGSLDAVKVILKP